MVIVQCACTGFIDEDAWHLCVGDVSTAFLQGSQSGAGRAGRLFMRPPPEPLVLENGKFGAMLYETLYDVHGLANAPCLRSCKVRLGMQQLGFRQHTLDCMIFIKYGHGSKFLA